MANLPPDPEGMNDERAGWAEDTLDHFRAVTGTDEEDALADLLCDLMHWCDRNAINTTFEAELEKARQHYREETTER